jgi:hypothetical protein
MASIIELVKAAWDHRQHPESPEHLAVLSELACRGPTLSEEERGCAANYLIWAVLDGAAENDHHKQLGIQTEGGLVSRYVVDEARYPHEIAWLKHFAKDLRLSANLEGWLARKRHDFVEKFRSDPGLGDDLARWPDMSPDHRELFLIRVIRARIISFGDERFFFTPPKISFFDDETGLQGSASSRLNEITLNRSICDSDDPTPALMTAYHEGTHNILTQLARMAAEGRIPERDPLFGDIRKLAHSRYYGLAPPGQLRSLYESDDEERLANQEAEFFEYNLREGNGLKAKFNLARHLIAQSDQSRIQKPGLRGALHGFRFV